MNGLQQLKWIKTFNDLATWIAVLKREKAEEEAAGQEEKKRKEAQKIERQEKRMRLEQEERERLAPACKEAVDRGIEFVLQQKNEVRKQILQIHFGVSAGVYKMKLAETENALRDLMSETLDTEESLGVTVPALPPIQPPTA